MFANFSLRQIAAFHVTSLRMFCVGYVDVDIFVECMAVQL